jgi:hypothetical protein
VERGMIGAFIGFGVEAPLATIAVLAYRTISYWLPTVPGVIAYFHVRHDLSQPAARTSALRRRAEAEPMNERPAHSARRPGCEKTAPCAGPRG